MSSRYDNSDIYLDAEITDKEIYTSLVETRNNKSTGPDEISNEFYKNLPQNWILYLNVLFNKIIKEERIPNEWASIHLTMLNKKVKKIYQATIDQLHWTTQQQKFLQKSLPKD